MIPPAKVCVFVGVLFVPAVVEAVIAMTGSAKELAGFWSLTGNFDLLFSMVLLEDVAVEAPTVLAPFLLLVVAGLAWAGMLRRLEQLEEVV